MKLSRLMVLVMVCGLVACGNPAASQPTATSNQPPVTGGRTITIGAVNSSPSKRIQAMQPLADYLSKQLADKGVGSVQIKIAANTDAMATLVQNGEVDVFFDTAYTALLIGAQAQAKPLLRWWKGGQAEYHSVFLTRADSSLKTLDQLKGSVVGFEQNFSTSGYFVPRTFLSTNGFKLQEVEDAKNSVAPETIGYAFSGSATNTIQWIISKRVPVGVINNTEYAELDQATRAQLQVLVETQPIPRAVVVFSDKLDATTQQAISTSLTTMHENADGQAALKSFDQTSKFDVLTAEQQQQLQKLYELSQQ